MAMYAILPWQGKACKVPADYARLSTIWTSAYLNGMSPLSHEWVETLQDLTSSERLCCLTMQTWQNVISNKSLVRSKKAWRSHCYEEMRQKNLIIYDPLLWALAAVNLCSRHQTILTIECPHCQKSMSQLAQQSRPGYCSYCQQWSGGSHTQQDQIMESKSQEQQKQLWRSEVVGALLAATQQAVT